MTLGTAKSLTNTLGEFELTIPAVADSLRIIHFTYKTYTAAINKSTTTLHIELEPATISLNAVTIHGDRDFRKDSISNRIAYAKQFNYTGPKVMDIFTGNPDKQPGELLSINLLTLVEVLTKKSTAEYKFNKILVRDEQAEYADRKFNRGNTSRITGLKGDTLSAFLINYRPSYQLAKQATDYDMEIYIRKCFKEFMKEGVAVSNPFARVDTSH